MTDKQKIKKLEAEIEDLKRRMQQQEMRPIGILAPFVIYPTKPASVDIPPADPWPGYPRPYVGDWPVLPPPVTISSGTMMGAADIGKASS